MFVCNCNGISESDLQRLAPHLRGCARRAYAALGKTPQCGQCLEDATEILRQRPLSGGASTKAAA